MINGKTIFSWNIPAVEGGNPEKIAKALSEANFDGVCLKAANGNEIFKLSKVSPWPKWGENIKPELVSALKAKGLKVYLWHFLYGTNPIGELSVAESQIERFKPDGYIWDVEGAFENQVNATRNARLITEGVKQHYPNLSQALCTWAFLRNPDKPEIEWHPVRVADAFLSVVDCIMPMTYWEGSYPSQAVSYLSKSIAGWRKITTKPIIPVGRCYTGDGGVATPEAMTAFSQRVRSKEKEENLIGTSWWSLDKGYVNKGMWSALKAMPQYGSRLSNDEILNRLVAAHIDLFPELN